MSRCYATASSLDRFLVGPDGHPEYEHYHVTVAKTAGQIALFLAEAKRLYRNGEAELTDRMKIDAVFVNAEPHQPSSGSVAGRNRTRRPAVEEQRRGGTAARAPTRRRSSGASPSAPGRVRIRASARFELRQVRELPAGEFDVVLVTQYGERRCKVGAKDRERLFGGR